MSFLLRFAFKIGINLLALYIAASYVPGFHVASTGPRDLVVAGVVLALVNLILRPVLRLISFPFLIITFGLFNIIINIVLLWIGDALSPAITIDSTTALIIASFIIGIANAII